VHTQSSYLSGSDCRIARKKWLVILVYVSLETSALGYLRKVVRSMTVSKLLVFWLLLFSKVTSALQSPESFIRSSLMSRHLVHDLVAIQHAHQVVHGGGHHFLQFCQNRVVF